jgi:hypothetical protein
LQEYGAGERRACGRLARSESPNGLPPLGRNRIEGRRLTHRGHGLGRNGWRRRRSLDCAALHPGAAVNGSRSRRQQRITTFVAGGCSRPFSDSRHHGEQQAHRNTDYGHRPAQPPTKRSHRHRQLCPQYAIRSTGANGRAADVRAPDCQRPPFHMSASPGSFMTRSMSAISIGRGADRFSYPVSVIRIASSRRM